MLSRLAFRRAVLTRGSATPRFHSTSNSFRRHFTAPSARRAAAADTAGPAAKKVSRARTTRRRRWDHELSRGESVGAPDRLRSPRPSALRFSLRRPVTGLFALISAALTAQFTSSRRSIQIIEKILFNSDFKALLTGCVLSIPLIGAVMGQRVKIDKDHVCPDCPNWSSSRTSQFAAPIELVHTSSADLNGKSHMQNAVLNGKMSTQNAILNAKIDTLSVRIDNLAAEFELFVRLTYPDHPIQTRPESHKR